MVSQFKPTWMVPAIYNVSPERLQQAGIKAILTDLDNTLIAWNNPDGTPQLQRWIEMMHKNDIRIVVVSNNNASRVSRAVSSLNLEFVSRSLKPLTRGIRQAQRQLNLTNDQVVMVGDQLLTDVWAANNAHVRSILVKPIIETDKWNTRPNRFLEQFVIRRLHKVYPTLTWQEDIK
ncbi:YqeG family HAD IIIA-type phosphatase [Furfurilactobacillus sp. WILCCON 0119]|uniref:YqeG family HAD IIIA-type phosphatase n=1 Tax=Furfurilactobacillus entadae TaxID=2922307 RepID=UPI0035ED2676